MATSLVPNDQPEVLKLEKDLPLKSASVLSVEEEIAAKDIPKDIVNAALASVPELAKRLVDLKDSIDSLRTLDDQALKTKLHARRDNENDDDSSDVSEEENDETQKTEDNRNGLKVLIEAIPEARRCNQDTFFNRYTPEDGLYAIEYLVAGPELAVEIEKRTQKSADAAEAGPVKASKGTHGNVKSSMEGVNQSDKAEWIQRVRINSQAILKALDRVNDGDENNLEHSVTIWRPFSPLIHYHEKMKAELERIEKERLPSTDGPSVSRGDGEAQAIAATNVASTINDKSDSDKSLDNTGEPGRLTGDDVTQLRCFVNFMEEHILPDHLAPRQADDLSPPKVRFDDLWYLFRPGDLVHVPIKSDNERAQKNNTSQTFFRVAQMTVPDAGDVDTCFDSEGICKTCERRVSFCLSTYRIDYDGEAYRAVERLIVMKRFHGEKDVTKLAVFPARFLKDKDAVLQDAIASGKNFHHHIKYPQGFYNGWTLTHTPTGEAVTDEKGDIIKKPKHIESDVILDFGEAFRSSPKWKPDVTRWSKVSNLGGWTLAFDHVPIRQWDNNKRKNQLSSAREYVVSESGIYQSETNAFLEHDQFLLQPQGQAQGEQPLSFSDEDYILLPRRMFAYSLWQRSFVQIDSHYLSKKSSSQSGREPFEELSIKPETKTVIESLVKSHFRRQKAERDGYEVESQDLIRGKGKGTVILLHGVPGVGKTATAEAIAQKWKKPLFPITCGDLGFTADSVENSLNEIFRLAHLWDCILLFDEADVFITQRDGTNLKKNALVSVFLRMLEYYNGILFLTTNRPGVLDEAVKSRVHLSLVYEKLDLAQTMEIFKTNIRRLEKAEEQRASRPGLDYDPLDIDEDSILSFAKKQFEECKANSDVGLWNGRQIRNAFVIAASLAHLDAEKKQAKAGQRKKISPELDGKHFQRVNDTTLLYDQYRWALKKRTDDENAHSAGERVDPMNHAVGQAKNVQSAKTLGVKKLSAS